MFIQDFLEQESSHINMSKFQQHVAKDDFLGAKGKLNFCSVCVLWIKETTLGFI